MSFTDRTAILLGKEAIETLRNSRVAVYGLGGVGAACAMDLARVGVGFLHAVDFDTVEESNLNRLYFGYRDRIGIPKTEVFADAARAVNPDIVVETERIFFSGEGAAGAVASAIASKCTVHADCVDSLNPKTNLIQALCASDIPFISSMGTAGRLDPSLLKITSVWRTRDCPLAKSVRDRLRYMGVSAVFPAVWSNEPAVPPVPPDPAAGNAGDEGPRGRLRMVQGSAPFVPQAAGHLMASWILRRLLGLLKDPVNGK